MNSLSSKVFHTWCTSSQCRWDKTWEEAGFWNVAIQNSWILLDNWSGSNEWKGSKIKIRLQCDGQQKLLACTSLTLTDYWGIGRWGITTLSWSWQAELNWTTAWWQQWYTHALTWMSHMSLGYGHVQLEMHQNCRDPYKSIPTASGCFHHIANTFWMVGDGNLQEVLPEEPLSWLLWAARRKVTQC